ncbi:hypothetical protein BKA70DRAFT_1166516, partial [Coprinopsis sp. MPI-PUGE-AT-0042]
MNLAPASLPLALSAKISAMFRKKGTPKPWEQRTGMEEDRFIGLPSDIIILVMGPTGAGKSTFISEFYTGNKFIAIGHGMESCTQEVSWYHAKLPSAHADLWERRLILVDTPGFDDSRTQDVDILQKVSDWLARVYDSQVPVAGIIYITNITQNRMNGTAKLNLSMFKKLCGESSYNKITMVSSHWQDLHDQTVGADREDMLKNDYWSDIVKGGAEVMRVRGAGDEERIIQQTIEVFLASEGKGEVEQPLQIQREIVDLRKSIPATQAGRELKYTLEEVLKLKKKAQVHGLDEKGKQELEVKKVILEKQIKALKMPLTERIWEFIG